MSYGDSRAVSTTTFHVQSAAVIPSLRPFGSPQLGASSRTPGEVPSERSRLDGSGLERLLR